MFGMHVKTTKARGSAGVPSRILTIQKRDNTNSTYTRVISTWYYSYPLVAEQDEATICLLLLLHTRSYQILSLCHISIEFRKYGGRSNQDHFLK